MQRSSSGAYTPCLQEDATIWCLHTLRKEDKMSARSCEARIKREQSKLERLQGQLCVADRDLKRAVQENCLA